jgi:hypothetical protein
MSGAGTALVNNNIIADAKHGAIVGLDHTRILTSDLTGQDAQHYAQLLIGSNAVR